MQDCNTQCSREDVCKFNITKPSVGKRMCANINIVKQDKRIQHCTYPAQRGDVCKFKIAHAQRRREDVGKFNIAGERTSKFNIVHSQRRRVDVYRFNIVHTQCRRKGVRFNNWPSQHRQEDKQNHRYTYPAQARGHANSILVSLFSSFSIYFWHSSSQACLVRSLLANF